LDAVDKPLGDDLAFPSREVNGLGGVLDWAVVVSQQVGQLGQINLGSRTTGEVVETTPPALELLLVSLRAILGDCCSGSG
jgi:hypothetical protein